MWTLKQTIARIGPRDQISHLWYPVSVMLLTWFS